MRVAVLDTGHANLTSVCRALEEAGKPLSITVVRTHDEGELARADKLVVPGQGGFGDCLRGIADQKELVIERVKSGVPYLGICLGLQALFDSSEEAPGVAGLGILGGINAKLTPAPGIKIPHMGWNQLRLENGGHPVLEAAGGNVAWVYFVHSFHALPDDPNVIKATVGHGPHTVTAAVAYDNVVATQFHPEKSQLAGLRLLRGFLDL